MSGTNTSSVTIKADPTWKIGIIASLWYRDIINNMIDAAKDTFIQAGIRPENITVYDAPGSYEIPLIGAKAIDHVDALIGFGIVLQGETKHAEAIMETVSTAMMQLQVEQKKPFAFEVLHVYDIEQARERATPGHNKGTEAAEAVIRSLDTLISIGS